MAPFSSSSIYRLFNRLTFSPPSPFLPHFLLGLSRSFRPTRSLAPSLPLFLFSPSGCFPPLGLNPVGHSGPLGCWLLYPASLPFLHLSFHPFHPHAPPQPKLSRSFRPTRSRTVLLLLFPPLPSSFHHCLDSVGHSGPLGLWLPIPLALLLSIIFTFLHSLDSVGHSGPLGPVLSSFFPSLLFPLPVTTALTQSVIPTHSVSGFLHLSPPPSLIFTFFHSLDSIGHSGPPSPWLPLHLFSLLFSWFLGFPTTA